VNDDGKQLTVTQDGTHVVINFSNMADASCATQSPYLDGDKSGFSLTGTRAVCDQGIPAICHPPTTRPFKARVTNTTISGTWEKHNFKWDTADTGDPINCQDVGTEQVPFTFTRQ
jgi:hypothetical protein